MGSAEGALRTAASRVGLGVTEYQDRINAGLRHCWRCQDWHPCADFGKDRTRWDGLATSCRSSLSAARRAAYQRRQRPSPGRRYVAARDDDRLQARRRVNHLVDVGVLPNPNTVPCADCEHIGDGPRHEYDHHLGYEAQHHEDVEPVCSPCHHRRERERAA